MDLLMQHAVICMMVITGWTRLQAVPEQTLDLDAWWGPTEFKNTNDTGIYPFKVTFDDETIKQLRFRLKIHREVPQPLDGAAFEYGFNSLQLSSWLQYWAEVYPFKKREKFLNQFPQYKTNIQGLDIHFLWVKPKAYPDQEVVPLLLLHGWPGSVREFYETIPYLTESKENRDFAVQVIAPSLPGFGFSAAAVRPGLGATEMAIVFRNLMWRLGYHNFYVQGGDWGAYIGGTLATLFPKEVLGFHTNLAFALTPKALGLTILGVVFPSYFLEPNLKHRMYTLIDDLKWLLSESGYFHLQATKPDTIGIALSDSPGGLLTYILQIFSSGSRRKFVYLADGGLDSLYTREQLIDNVMMYYVPNSITTAFRMYAETANMKTLTMGVYAQPTPVPTCVMQAKDEIIYQPPSILETKFSNLVNVTVLDNGGHFLALEMPKVFAENVLDAIRLFRKWHAMKRRESRSDNNN